MTKKLLAVLTAAFLMCGFAFADDYQSQTANIEDRTDQVEVYLGYGTCSCIPVVVNIFGGIAGALSGADKVDGHMYGVVSGGVNKYFANWFLMGLYGSYECFDMGFDDGDKTVMSITTVQGRMLFQYGPKSLKFYHGVNAGMAFYTSADENSRSFMCGITPFGMKADIADNVALYGEVGLVANAFFTGGVNIRF